MAMSIFCYEPGGNTLHHNNGDGTFTDVTPKLGGRQRLARACFDYDGTAAWI
jgi:hypothetical protein